MTRLSWRYAAASSLGTSHAKLDAACQDAHACEILLTTAGEPILVAVVADGAGSAARSGEGADLACSLVLEEVRALCERSGLAALSRDLVLDWLLRFQSEIGVRAGAEGLTPRDFACTLVAAVVARDQASFFQIGDGAILAGQAGIGGHLTIGAGARIGAQAGVFGDVPAGESWSGYPARPHRESLRASAALFRLAGMMRRLEKLLADPEPR